MPAADNPVKDFEDSTYIEEFLFLAAYFLSPFCSLGWYLTHELDSETNGRFLCIKQNNPHQNIIE